MNNNILKLLVEEVDPQDFDFIIEEQNKESSPSYYIKGPFFMAEKINKNKRRYNINESIKEINRYRTEMIDKHRAMGELKHPMSVEIDPERACHLVLELNQNGNFFIGKSKVLNSPMGIIVKNLMKDGVRLGVSSRSLGKIDENTNYVTDMHLIAFDVVSDPSVETAFVDGILESKQWILNENGEFIEYFDKFEKSLDTLPKQDVSTYLKEQIINFIRNINKK